MHVFIKYNPYTVETEIKLAGHPLPENSPLLYARDKRLQEWIEPHENWKGLFRELQEAGNYANVEIDFHGTAYDFADLVYAKEKYGQCFLQAELIHVNSQEAARADDAAKLRKMREIYEKIRGGPVDGLKDPKIRASFEKALDSAFEIVVVAPMSSGKSTLINAILHQDLLPALNQATTAVITRIRDNDDMKNFSVSWKNRGGEITHSAEPASPELIQEINAAKGPDGQALYQEIFLEGRIPGLPSDKIQTVFVDTPGGNNSQNREHMKLMENAINDENKGLILYVFNGLQVGTDESDDILKKIAAAMKKSTKGKQSRDRFLFVANRMDSFDLERESYESIVQNTILRHLRKHGIEDPHLFLVSSQAAKLIRKRGSGVSLSEAEYDIWDMTIKKFTRDNRSLFEFSSLSESRKAEFREKIRAEKEAHGGADKIVSVAEINSGIPAVESAIREYLEKYAISIKIKTLHDAFMNMVAELDLLSEAKKQEALSGGKYIREAFAKKQQRRFAEAKSYFDRGDAAFFTAIRDALTEMTRQEEAINMLEAKSGASEWLKERIHEVKSLLEI